MSNYREREGDVDYDRLKVACDYDDEAEISFTAVQTAYVVGTNANAAATGAWPAVAGVPLADAKNTLFMATQDCFVRFEGATRRQHRLFAGVYYTFRRRWAIIYITRVAADGNLYCWIEG